MSNDVFDVIIIGGGPAGAAAGVYAGRKKLKALLLTEGFGGQSVASGTIGNWIGVQSISGAELAIALEDHLRAQQGLMIREPEKAAAIGAEGDVFTVTTARGSAYRGLTVIIATGGRHRQLNVPGGKEFEGRGIAYCSTCDAPIFRGKKVAVVGSGNAGLEAAYDLRDYASSVCVFDITAEPTGDKQTADNVFCLPQASFVPQTEIRAIKGDDWVRAIEYLDRPTGAVKTMGVEGVFVAIGSRPNSEFARGLIEINEKGEIVVSRPAYATSRPGIFAAGDVTDEPFRQNNIAAGDGIKALLSASQYLKKSQASAD